MAEDDDEFERKVISLRDVVEPMQPRRLRPLETARWDNVAVPEPDWTVLNRIPRRQCALFSGEGAMGKSTLLLQLCAAHAAARDWLFTMPEPGPAIFMDAEDDQDVIHRRLSFVAKHYQLRFADLAQLTLFSLAGEDALLGVTSRRTGKVEPTALYTELLTFVADVRPVMIGLASAANFFSGNENDRGEVQQFIGLLTRLAIMSNGSVVLVSHPSLTGIASGSGMSGSTQWHNAVRARFFLRGVKRQDDDGGEPDNDLREIEFKKNNYGPLAERITLQFRDGMFLPMPKKSSLAQAASDLRDDELFLSVLGRLNAQGRTASLNKGPTYAPAVMLDTPEAKLARITGARLRASMDRLVDAGRVQSELYGPPSHRRSRLVIR